MKFVLVSLLVLVPCFWQPAIQAGDLSSHLYNAWLTLELDAGRISGLTLAPVWTNSLFDRLLELTMRWGGPWFAEHLCTSVAVLAFFWGLAACTRAVTGSMPWSFLPLAAMLAYGAIFRIGFMNFYGATAASLWAMAVWWSCRGLRRCLCVPLVVLAVLFHAIPAAWAVAVVVYVEICRRLSARGRVLLFGISLGVLAAAIGSVRMLMHVESSSSIWSFAGFLSAAGLIPYWAQSDKYAFICIEILLLLYFVFQRHIRSGGSRSLLNDPVVQAGGLLIAACLMVPQHVYLPMYTAALGFVDLRIAFFTAIVTIFVLGRDTPPQGERMILYAAACAFFYFSWVDERTANSVEQAVARHVSRLPAGSRVVSVFSREPLQVTFYAHAVDRACIGRCVSYANYEPTSKQFRLRAEPDSPVVLPEAEKTNLEKGTYIVRPQDAPLFVIRACGEAESALCADKLEAGEKVIRRNLTVQTSWW